MRIMPAVKPACMPERLPAGRAGRLWLLDRIDAAQRGRDLLDRKRQLLRRQFDQLALLAEERRHALTAACADAETWGLRAALLGGSAETALVAGAVSGQARVTVKWRNTMGARHPDEAHCELPELAPPELGAANAALGPAAAAYRRALTLAVEVAVAETARQKIGDELQATQRRLRGIERHRVPALQDALRTLDLQLEELEREERVVTRWARTRMRR
jgi:V/A-type H+-transporting ATPase subunit D